MYAFFGILASTYDPGLRSCPGPRGPYGPGPLIILEEYSKFKWSRTKFGKYDTAPGPYNKQALGPVDGPEAYLIYKVLSNYEWFMTIWS